jgi:hypothetical protein
MLLDCSVQVYNQPRLSASQLSPASAHLGFAVGTDYTTEWIPGHLGVSLPIG